MLQHGVRVTFAGVRMSLSLKGKMERPKHALVQPMESSLEALHAERYQLHHLSLVALFGGSQKLFS